MGLDWFPSNRPKPGHEAEFAQLSSLDLSQVDEWRAAQAETRLREINESPFDFARAQGHWRSLSFRAELPRDTVEVIGEPLLNRAWEPQTAAELAAYGAALLAAAQSFASKHHLDWAELSEIPATASDKGNPALAACRIAVGAARWCLWWSARGFGLDPDY